MKHILITGGSDGLGKITARMLRKLGHEVTILTNDEEQAKAVGDEIDVLYTVADVANWKQLSSAVARVEKVAPIDVLINCAGTWTAGTLEQNKPETIRDVLDVNVLGTIYATKAVSPGMIEQRRGRIINIISQDAKTVRPERSIYSASKWAVAGFTKSMHDELKPYGVAVSGVYPGLMKTNLFEKNGVERDLRGAIDPVRVAGTLVYLVAQTDDTDIPELSVMSMSV